MELQRGSSTAFGKPNVRTGVTKRTCKNLVKTNLSVGNGFPANPSRAKPRLLDPFAASNTGNVTINKHWNHSGKVCKTLWKQTFPARAALQGIRLEPNLGSWNHSRNQIPAAQQRWICWETFVKPYDS